MNETNLKINNDEMETKNESVVGLTSGETIDTESLEAFKKLLSGEVEKIRENMFTLFGIFASVVAFLLVEVQVLKSTTSWQVLMGISLIILGALSFFVLLIKIVLSSKESRKFGTGILLIISFIFILGGVYIASQGNGGQTGTIKYEKNFYSDIKYR